MILVYIFSALGTIPMILFLLTVIKHKHYKIIFRQFLIQGIIWLVIFGFSLALHIHYWTAYEMPILPNWDNIKIIIYIVLGFFVLIMLVALLTNIGPYFWESVVSQGRIYLLFAVFSLNLMVIVGFFIPIGEKYNYTDILERAQYHLEKVEPSEDQPIMATVAASQRDCYKRSSTCNRRRADYENLVVMKNTTDQGLWVEMKIDFINHRDEVMDTFEYGPVYLEARETLPVLSEEEIQNEDAWDRWTIVTDDRTASIQYSYRVKAE